MSADPGSHDPVVNTVLHDPDEDIVHGHAFDSPEEVAHAQLHAKQNIFFFIGFFSLILVNVAIYEFTPQNNYWFIFLCAASRALLIAFFFNWLFGNFSFVVRTIIFTVFFLGGMVFLSMFDSTLPKIGNPIQRPGAPSVTSAR